MNRSAILTMLRNRTGQFVSGEELGRQLSISRTAVSKQIQKLRLEGYDIESTVSQGHRLLRLPDLLRPEEVCPRLTTNIMGSEIYYFSEIGSTNDEAKKTGDYWLPRRNTGHYRDPVGGAWPSFTQMVFPCGKGNLVFRRVTTTFSAAGSPQVHIDGGGGPEPGNTGYNRHSVRY